MPHYFGEVQGATSATQLPDVPCSRARIKARDDNSGNVYIGNSGVTKPNGTTDATTGFPLDAGDETGWFYLSNLNELYCICDNAGDDFIYWAQV